MPLLPARATQGHTEGWTPTAMLPGLKADYGARKCFYQDRKENIAKDSGFGETYSCSRANFISHPEQSMQTVLNYWWTQRCPVCD